MDIGGKMSGEFRVGEDRRGVESGRVGGEWMGVES